MQPRMDRRHHRNVDIACAGRIHLPGCALLRLGRAELQSKNSAPFATPGSAATAA